MTYKDILVQYGNDVEKILVKFNGNEALHKKFVKLFFQREDMEKLKKLYENEKYIEILMKAHSYKQISGNLGLLKLCEDFGRIVDKVYAKDYESLGELIKATLAGKAEIEKALEKAVDWNN